MCELLGMSARLPASITLSLNELARRGGETGPHADGWGIAFYDGPDANLIRESAAAASSSLMSTLRTHKLRSKTVLAHIRLASQGGVELKNTHPFRRELGGDVHTFAHNGNLPGVKTHLSLDGNSFIRPVGETDSEHVFCVLAARIMGLWLRSNGRPSLMSRIETVQQFACEISEFGSANFLYSDGNVLFVYGHQRKQADGVTRPPGLYFANVDCLYGNGKTKLVGLEYTSIQSRQFPAEPQRVTIVSTTPLRDRGWKPMHKGQLLVVQDGEIIWDSARIETRSNASMELGYESGYNYFRGMKNINPANDPGEGQVTVGGAG